MLAVILTFKLAACRVEIIVIATTTSFISHSYLPTRSKWPSIAHQLVPNLLYVRIPRGQSSLAGGRHRFVDYVASSAKLLQHVPSYSGCLEHQLGLYGGCPLALAVLLCYAHITALNPRRHPNHRAHVLKVFKLVGILHLDFVSHSLALVHYFKHLKRLPAKLLLGGSCEINWFI